jgi:proteasome assembly chaperone (PAC2) family protein
MPNDPLTFTRTPTLSGGTMLLAFSGWMDGGEVSTGTVRRLMDYLDVDQIAHIDPEDFYLYSFPGAMELAAMFRPHVKYDDGMVTAYTAPTNTFYCDEARNLVLFVGKEPNLHWRAFADCIFAVAQRVGVTRLFFVGSFGGTVPHTREPRLFASVSDQSLKPLLRKFGARFSDYEGPAAFSTHLMVEARDHGVQMVSLAAEIPGYIQGVNPLSIEAVIRRLALILGLQVDLAQLRAASDDWESQVTAMVQKDPKLAKQIRELEEQYDKDLLDASETG